MRTRLPSLVAVLITFGCGDSPLGPSNAGGGNQGRQQGAQSRATPPPQSTPAAPVFDPVQGLVTSSNALGLKIYDHARSAPGNLALSPASLGIAIGMTWAGARGETAAGMASALGFEGAPALLALGWSQLSSVLEDPDAPFTFRIANRLFGDASYAFDPTFLETTQASWGAPLEVVSFRDAPEEARKGINDWVEERTDDRIRDLVPAGGVTNETRLVLVNALYFLGKWARPFDAEVTQPAPFHVAPDAPKDVPTMRQTGPFRLATLEGLRALELPYVGERLAMLVVLPDALDGLDAVEQGLSAARLAEIRAGLAPAEVAVSLPRFSIDPPAPLPLSDVLRGLGMAAAFDPDLADFTGIANPPDPADRLRIDEVFHKAFVEVDERGTEAAAGTAVAMVRAASLPATPPVEFNADRPFLFFILEQETGLIVFAGRVADPAS